MLDLHLCLERYRPLLVKLIQRPPLWRSIWRARRSRHLEQLRRRRLHLLRPPLIRLRRRHLPLWERDHLLELETAY